MTVYNWNTVSYLACSYSQDDGPCRDGLILAHGGPWPIGDIASNEYEASISWHRFASCGTTPSCICTRPWWGFWWTWNEIDFNLWYRRFSLFLAEFSGSESIFITMSSKLNLLSYAWCMGFSSYKQRLFLNSVTIYVLFNFELHLRWNSKCKDMFRV